MAQRASPIVGAAAVAAELLACGRAVRFSAPGGSMHPTIRNGEFITVAPIAPAAIAAGDIVLFRRGMRLVAHRVIGCAHGGGNLRFVTRGDAAPAADMPVDGSDILGRVVEVERDGRRLDLTARRSLWSGRIGRCLNVVRAAARRARFLRTVKP